MFMHAQNNLYPIPSLILRKGPLEVILGVFLSCSAVPGVDDLLHRSLQEKCKS